MNDQQQVDNPPDISLKFPAEEVRTTFSSDSRLPGPETGSTPINLKDFTQQQAKTDDLLIQALMKDINSEESPPINNQPAKKVEVKKISNQQKGFLANFVNGFNNFFEGIWNGLKSLVPMKPQTGAG